MSRISRTILSASIASAALIAPFDETTAQQAPAPGNAAVVRAIDLYEAAGLHLPELTVTTSSDKEACSGHGGVHHPHDGWSEIVLCVDGGSWSQRVLLHELAHAWVGANVTAEVRAAFQELRGWTYWRDYERAAWEDNGTEQAAEIIAWGVNDVGAPTVAIADASCAQLRAGYEVLTGAEPHGSTKFCDNATVIDRK